MNKLTQAQYVTSEICKLKHFDRRIVEFVYSLFFDAVGWTIGNFLAVESVAVFF